VSGRIEGKVALITGAGGGVGRATAIRFAQEGARLALTDVNQEELEKTAAEIAEIAEAPSVWVTDLRDVDALGTLVDDAASALGRLDILHNNAAVVVSGRIEDHDLAMYQLAQDVNVRSQFFLSKAALPVMRANGGGSIVNMSSVSAELGCTEVPAYSISKAGVIGLTRSFAIDLAPMGIRVNALVPARIDTGLPRQFLKDIKPEDRAQMEGTFFSYPRQLIKRPASPAEIAGAVLFLASDEAAFITGTVLHIDGGYSAW
jgi:NAD(P)-dependent dehydrogenase (short-subunit alcohol dehydrogenase family)